MLIGNVNKQKLEIIIHLILYENIRKPKTKTKNGQIWEKFQTPEAPPPP